METWSDGGGFFNVWTRWEQSQGNLSIHASVDILVCTGIFCFLKYLGYALVRLCTHFVFVLGTTTKIYFQLPAGVMLHSTM